jgi:hypothetical protein
MLQQLLLRQTFQEQWPDTYQRGLVQGKQRILKLEQIRTQTITMNDILISRADVYDWWNKIA